ncbi:MAG: signal peptide peptidase SppA [Candidatus Binatales bacterium]
MLKRLFRWLIRTAVIVLVLFLIAAIADYVNHRVKPGSVLVVTLDGPVVERARGGISALLNAGKATPLDQVRSALDQAGRDQRIAGAALKIIDPEMELAQAQEIAALVKDFASHGKWTTAYMETAGEEGPGNLPYLVASATSEVAMMPQGEINLIGVGVREIFARSAFDLLGIRPNFAAIGKYKSAMNIFTEKDFTPGQREEDESLVSDLYGQLVSQISDQRHLAQDSIRAMIDQAPLSAETGLKMHLVDRLEYQEAFDDRVKHHGGGEEHALVDYDDYVRPRMLPSIHSRDRIAVIYGDGDIVRNPGELGPGGDSMTADRMVGAFKSAREDDSVKAIVLRINSPGGSVLASELIRHAAELAAIEKPMIVSMSSYGASGGYWIATPARRIFAEPGTITGSIGVLAGKFNLAPMAQKFGVNTGSITLGANFEMFDEFTDFTPAQEKTLRDQLLGDTYQRFVKLVAESRHLTYQQVDQVAQGRVWTGAQAAGIKLVDGLGGFDAALAAAKTEAKLAPGTPLELVELPEQPSAIGQLLSGGLGGYASRGPAASLTRTWRWMAKIAAARRIGGLYCPLAPVM